jgi:hypothetical protein
LCLEGTRSNAERGDPERHSEPERHRNPRARHVFSSGSCAGIDPAAIIMREICMD